MTSRGPRLPSGATIVAWLGIVGTLMGIVSFFVLDLPNIIGGRDADDPRLSEASIIATLAALQDEKNQAQIQLTQIAIANVQAANQSTQQALAEQQAIFQSTLDAARAEQEAFAATRNAIAAASATADAETQAANASATQAVLDAGATQAAIAQVTPTPTDSPTNTPVPEVVSDYRALTNVIVGINQQGQLEFAADAASSIPDQEGLAYIWALDTDFDPATGFTVQDIGVDLRVTLSFENGGWVGTVRSVSPEGQVGDAFLYFPEVKVNGPHISGSIDPSQLNNGAGFNWAARSELGNQVYSYVPVDGHLTFTP